MKFLVPILVLVAVALSCPCCREAEPRLLNYALELHPGMNASEVLACIPRAMLRSDERAEEPVMSMDRRWSSNAVARRLYYHDLDVYGMGSLTIWFDDGDRIIGLHYSASSGQQLRECDLRFSQEIRDRN
jgi:hypothetical protein